MILAIFDRNGNYTFRYTDAEGAIYITQVTATDDGDAIRLGFYVRYDMTLEIWHQGKLVKQWNAVGPRHVSR